MIEQEMVERAAKALEKLTDQKTYGWTDEEFEIWWNKDPNFVTKVLLSDTVKLTIGSEDWDLTEPEEMELWKIREDLEAHGDTQS